MAGIVSYSSYVPYWRLGPGTAGWRFPDTRAVAGPDEDSITMAVAAARDCLAERQATAVDGITFATTTSPYAEKQCAALIAAACDTRGNITTADAAGSLRSGTIALRSLLDTLQAGSARQLLLTAADCRLVPPGSETEGTTGDGAAALLLGTSEVIAEFLGSSSITDPVYDVWRPAGEMYLRSWEDRFVFQEGYLRATRQAIESLLAAKGLTPGNIARAAFFGPDRRRHTELASGLGFSVAQTQDPLLDQAGSCGAAHCLMLLAAALEETKPGDYILLASYGDGADALLFRTTELIGKFGRPRWSTHRYLGSVRMVPNYNDYLRWRGMLQTAAAVSRPPSLGPSPVALRREQNAVLRLHGVRCRRCGAVQYPPPRVCVKCRAKDDFEPAPLADRKAEVFTYTLNYIGSGAIRPDAVAVINFDGGGRMLCNLTDYDPKEVTIGLPVEMTFRKIEYAGGIHNYFWKATPRRSLCKA